MKPTKKKSTPKVSPATQKQIERREFIRKEDERTIWQIMPTLGHEKVHTLAKVAIDMRDAVPTQMWLYQRLLRAIFGPPSSNPDSRKVKAKR